MSNCSWPQKEGVEVVGDDPEKILEQALEEAEREARESGKYDPGDRVWCIVWDEDGDHAAAGSREVE